jgi:blocked-early-in-transport protein 1
MGSGSNGSGYSRTAMHLEGQNDDKLEGLLGKVKILKDVSRALCDDSSVGRFGP